MRRRQQNRGNASKIPPGSQRCQDMKNRLRLKVAAKKGPKLICLVMIVKNEEANMKRLLDSLTGLVDMVSIVDTGSTDNTEKVILKWGKENKVPTTVHHEIFRNFAYNRTHSVKAAKSAYPNADYFLLSDADFVWNIDVGGKFDKSLLIDHKYLIKQYNTSLGYWNIRMLSAQVDWECVCLTHEYWTECEKQSVYSGEIRQAKITTLTIDDREDGGCKTDKFERDERLLREGLADPETIPGHRTRYKFYLAQTLKDVGRYAESIEWYKERIKDGGWYEEVFYAKYQIGFNYEQLGWKSRHIVYLMSLDELNDEDVEFMMKWNPEMLDEKALTEKYQTSFENAAKWYWKAYESCKTRAESVYSLARMYRQLENHEESLKYALIGQKIKYPVNDTLFIESACYTYLFDYEISIVAYYIPEKKDLGRIAVSKLIDREDMPEDMINLVRNNSKHYL